MSFFLKKFALLPIKRNLKYIECINRYSYFSTIVTPKLIPQATTANNDIIKLTPASSSQIDKICTNNAFLRILVDNGGCTGFQYKFEMVTKLLEDDIICGAQKRIVIDRLSAQYCYGATLDYHEDIMRAGFRMKSNPKAETACSCGVSFALKTD